MEKTDCVAGLGSGILLGYTPRLLGHPALWPQLVSVSLLRTPIEGKTEVISPSWTGGLQTSFRQM